MNTKLIRGSFWTVIFFYLLIAFEFFYMASPFAVYFYSVYKPALLFLDRFPAVAWTTGFFMPHLVEETTSVMLNSMKIVGFIIALVGLITFLICATQVYYAKLFKKGVVTGGLYRYIRHPQYTAFAVCSFGLLLLWPRYLALIMFITVLFAYYLLAGIEEKECERKYGKSYLDYKNNTAAFLPFLRLNLFEKSNIRRLPRTGIILLTYALFLFLGIQAANGIKRLSIKSLYTNYSENTAYLSIFNMDNAEIRQLIGLSQMTSFTDNLFENKTNPGMIGYIMPAEFYISEIPMIKPDSATCHIYNKEFNNSIYKLIYTEGISKSKPGNITDILYKAISLKPVAEIWVDLKQKKIVKRVQLTDRSIRYKNIAEPIF